MKQTIILLSALLSIWGCTQSSSKSSGTSGTSSGNPITGCTTTDYNTVGSACYCSLNPSNSSCTGSTTGSTSGGTTYTGISDSVNNWTARYNTSGKPTASSTINCSTPVNQASGPNYAPRKGTIHMAFRKNYRPDISGLSNFSTNISYFLTSVSSAAGFLDSDGHLKVRFMPRPQRVPAAGDVWCYGRTTGSGSGTAYGYSELTYSVGVYGIQNGALVGPLKTDYFTTNIQSCSPAVDYTGYNQSYPEGIVISVFDVYSNQSCPSYPCSGTSQVSTTCWGMDIEVASDTTKTFQ